MALHSHLGHLHSRDFRCSLLPTDCHCQSRLHHHRESSATEPSHLDPRHHRHWRHRLLRRQWETSSTSLSPGSLHRHHGLLRRPSSLPLQRRSLHRNPHRQRLHLRLLPPHVALARANHLPRHRLRLQHRLRQQLWTNWRGDRAADLQTGVCAEVSGEFCECYGAGGALYGDYVGDVVGD